MSNQTQTIVPLEAWAYASPDVKLTGKSTDLGLFAEALIYYDHVLVQPSTPTQLADLLSWFLRDDAFDDLLTLLHERTIEIYEYSFITTTIRQTDGVFSLWNIEDEAQQKRGSFEQRYLYHPSIEALIPKQRRRVQLYSAFRDRVIEAKSAEFGDVIEASRQDHLEPRRNAIVLQAFVDELYRVKKAGRPPMVSPTVVRDASDRNRYHIDWGVDIPALSQAAGSELNFHLSTPLIAGATASRLLLSASRLGSDLYLPRPMASLVGDKLYESTERVAKAGEIISDLKAEVEFPDIRTLVNHGQLSIRDILTIRKRANRFRTWLQQESGRDRNAIIAYHQEVAKESGLLSAGRKALEFFGVLSATVAGAAISHSSLGAAAGLVAGTAAKSGIKYMTDLVGRLGQDWRPVVFGNWMRGNITGLLQERSGDDDK